MKERDACLLPLIYVSVLLAVQQARRRSVWRDRRIVVGHFEAIDQPAKLMHGAMTS